MNKAIFLDRDGIINKERGEYTYLIEDFELVEGIIDAIKFFKEKGFLIIIISNQGGIAKQQYAREDVAILHDFLINFLAKHEIELDAIYYCPHHPVYGNCICRKPDSLMLEKAMARFNIDPNASWFFGDAGRDIVAGEKAGIKSLMIEANKPLLQQQIIKDIFNIT